MKKFILIAAICLFKTALVSAQYLPDFQMGAKAGATYSLIPSNIDYSNKGVPGYVVGAWARWRWNDIFFQPEVYGTSKNVDISSTYGGYKSIDYPSRLTSLDFPLLVGKKVGDVGLGGRFYAGPVFSYAINKDQSFGSEASRSVRLTYVDQNYGLQIGAGIDIQQFSLDLRYEAGLNKVYYGEDSAAHSHLNYISLTLAYSIFSDFY